MKENEVTLEYIKYCKDKAETAIAGILETFTKSTGLTVLTTHQEHDKPCFMNGGNGSMKYKVKISLDV